MNDDYEDEDTVKDKGNDVGDNNTDDDDDTDDDGNRDNKVYLKTDDCDDKDGDRSHNDGYASSKGGNSTLKSSVSKLSGKRILRASNCLYLEKASAM